MIQTNRLLHALLNRKGPFEDPRFFVLPAFLPVTPSIEELQLRKALLLDQTDTDYYVRALLSAVSAYPDIHELLADRHITYRVTEFPPRGVELDGAELSSRVGGSGLYTDHHPGTLPVTLTWTLDYIGESQLRLRGLETGLEWRIAYTRSGDVARPLLRPTWPAEVPFSGLLQVQQPWVSGAMVRIRVTPSRFPYAELVRRLTGLPLLMTLLTRYQFVDEYVTTPDVQRKVAIATVLLALQHPGLHAD